MATSVAINGLGRIGRQVLRWMLGDDDLEVVTITSARANPEICAHLLKYDSVFGRYPGDVDTDETNLIVEGRTIRITDQRDPLLCPWHAYGVDVVIEATGHFTERDPPAKHLRAGAARVLITAPARYEDITVVFGVNDDAYNPSRHRIVSAASCTTNCLAPLLKILNGS